MKYISTRGGIRPIGFKDAVLMGLASDGGLLVPDHIPDVSSELRRWRPCSYHDLTAEIMRLFTDLPPDELQPLIARSYGTFRVPEIAPVVPVGPVHVLELFHGPTLAFKDIALQFLGNLLDAILAERGQRLNVLVATSGDTGSAAIHALRGKDRIRVFVMHPRGKISRTQERQMTSVLDGNVFNLAIEGTFDDCQRMMKALFSDLPFKDRASLGSVNSINWARLLAQMVYYFYGAFRVMERTGAERIRFAVPTGNFGDIFAGYLAVRMGLPISRLVLATNENDVLSRFYNTGIYRPAAARPTISPSMDIQVASNFERYLYYREGEDPVRVAQRLKDLADTGQLEVKRLESGRVDDLFVAGAADTQETLAAIKGYHEKHGYLLDPHTAVGVSIAGRHLDRQEPMICLATAHPAKFRAAIQQALGKDSARHPVLDALEDLPTRCEVLPASVQHVRDYIASRV